MNKKGGSTLKKSLSLKLHKYTKLHHWKKLVFALFRTLLFGGLIYVLVYPVLFILSTSFKSAADIVDTTTIWLPKSPTFETYKVAFKAMNFMQGFKNSMIIAGVSTFGHIMSCSLIAYGMARFKFREKNLLFGLVILTLIIPPQTIIIPQFIHFRNFDILGIKHLLTGSGWNLLDTYSPFVVPTLFGFGLKSGLFIYIFRQFFRGMPSELEDAAYIDGCGPFKTYWRIMMPNSRPAILTVFLFSFVWHWNDVFEPSMYLHSYEMYTLSQKLLGIVGYIVKGSQVTNQTFLIPTKYAGVMLAIIPMLILYVVGQRYFVQGVERSGIVG
jgi:multiple sugar transport system permease protein